LTRKSEIIALSTIAGRERGYARIATPRHADAHGAQGGIGVPLPRWPAPLLGNRARPHELHISATIDRRRCSAQSSGPFTKRLWRDEKSACDHPIQRDFHTPPNLS
jgi:hypothetical protein